MRGNYLVPPPVEVLYPSENTLSEFIVPQQPSWVFTCDGYRYDTLEAALAARQPNAYIYCRLRESLESP